MCRAVRCRTAAPLRAAAEAGDVARWPRQFQCSFVVLAVVQGVLSAARKFQRLALFWENTPVGYCLLLALEMV